MTCFDPCMSKAGWSRPACPAPAERPKNSPRGLRHTGRSFDSNVSQQIGVSTRAIQLKRSDLNIQSFA
ncbi:hypothetical protein OKW11_006046 [Pseudomonas baetica]|nr:hypothetical protein [Pseudomonas baetica]